MMDDLSMSNLAIEALEHGFDPPFTESNVENDPSIFLSLCISQAGVNLSPRPSDIEISSPENLKQSLQMDKETGFGKSELEKQKGLGKKEKRKLIKPNDFEQSVHYVSFSPEQTLNMHVAGLDPILNDKDGTV